MSTVGRLKNGDLLLQGEINERIPIVTDGIIKHFPFDDTEKPIFEGMVYKNLEKEWTTSDFIPGQVDPAHKQITATEQVVLEADIYLEATPGEHYTVLQSIGQYTVYLSIDSSRKVSVYNYGKTSAGYHKSNQILNLNTWYKVTHISTETETVIMIDGIVDKVIANTNKGTNSITSIRVGAESASRHFQGKITNIKVDIFDPRGLSTNTNTTLTKDGIFVEEATTNLITSLDGHGSSFVDTGEKFFNGEPIYKNTVTSPSTGNNFGFRQIADKTLNQSGPKNLTLSFWVKNAIVQSTMSGYVRVVYTDGTAISHSWSYNPNPFTNSEYLREWTYVTATVDLSSTKTPDYISHFYVYRDNSPEGEMYISSVQVEQRAFATSFTNNSRGKGVFKIPITPELIEEGTMVWKATLTKGTTGTRSLGFQWDTGGSGNGHFGVKYVVTNKIFQIYYADSPDQVPYDLDDKEHTYVWTYKNGVSHQFYIDGIKVLDTSTGTMNNTTRRDNAFPIGLTGWTYDSEQWNGCVHSFSIYDRKLTELEAKKLHENKFLITQNGNLLTTEVTEKPNTIPKDAIHFPLDFDGSDKSRLIKPSSETSTSYENGAVWLGKSVTNLLYDNGVFNGSFGGLTLTPTVTTITPNNRYRITTNSGAGSTIRFYVPLAKLTNGTTYNMSYKYKLIKGTTFNMGDWCDTSVTKTDIDYGEYTFSSAYGMRSTYDSTFRFMDFNISPDAEVEIWDIQLETGSYPSAFINGTRPYNRLNYTGADLTKNNWQEFTLLFWVKYVSNTGWRLCGAWSRFYFGPNGSNSLNFAWVGYSGAGDTTSSQNNVAGGAVPVGKWTMIGCSVKNNEFIDLYIDGVRTLNWKNQFQLNNSATNFALNSLDHTSTSYPQNAWLKDMIIAGYAMTPDEIALIYNKQMAAYSNHLQIQGTIRERSL